MEGVLKQKIHQNYTMQGFNSSKEKLTQGRLHLEKEFMLFFFFQGGQRQRVEGRRRDPEEAGTGFAVRAHPVGSVR